MDTHSSHEVHRRKAEDHAKATPVSCAILTISDTRTVETDSGGPLVARHVQQAGHAVVAQVIIQDQPNHIHRQLTEWIADPDINVIITTGGTGVSRRDLTVDVIRPLLTYELPGFGELFRLLSFEQVKSAAILTRALAGVVINEDRPDSDTFIFALPGSTNAVETAMRDLITPQLEHLVWERRP